MSTLQNTVLAQIQYVPSSAGALYDNPASTTTYVKGILLHNTNATTETISVYWVQNSSGALGTAAIGNRFWNILLAAGDSRMIEFPASGIVLTAQHDSIQAVTTTASKVAAILFGNTAV